MTSLVGSRVLVAGIGNVFFGDDGFGPAVLARLPADQLGSQVDACDYGIRGVHLAYQLLERRHRCLILVDAMPRGAPPGTLSVLEVDEPASFDDGIVDAHAMGPGAVLSCLAALGGSVPEVLVVGCEPASLDTGMTLSAPVTAALDPAVQLVVDLVADVVTARTGKEALSDA